MHFNNVLVYIIVTKRFVTYPDLIEKFRSPGYTIKETKQGYSLYSCTPKYVPGGKTKCCPSPISAINYFGGIYRPFNSWRANSPNPIQMNYTKIT